MALFLLCCAQFLYSSHQHLISHFCKSRNHIGHYHQDESTRMKHKLKTRVCVKFMLSCMKGRGEHSNHQNIMRNKMLLSCINLSGKVHCTTSAHLTMISPIPHCKSTFTPHVCLKNSYIGRCPSDMQCYTVIMLGLARCTNGCW